MNALAIRPTGLKHCMTEPRFRLDLELSRLYPEIGQPLPGHGKSIGALRFCLLARDHNAANPAKMATWDGIC